MAAMNGQSGFKIEFTCDRREGRSFIQWIEREDSTASKVSGAYGRDSRLGTASLVIGI
jgi:hypothetical protein